MSVAMLLRINPVSRLLSVSSKANLQYIKPVSESKLNIAPGTGIVSPLPSTVYVIDFVILNDVPLTFKLLT